MGAWDLLKSERGVVQLLFLCVLAALLFTGASNEAVQTWALYAGGTTSIYTIAKSAAPGPRAKAKAPANGVIPVVE